MPHASPGATGKLGARSHVRGREDVGSRGLAVGRDGCHPAFFFTVVFMARPRKAEVSAAAGLGQGGAARAGIYFRSQHISYSRHRVLK